MVSKYKYLVHFALTGAQNSRRSFWLTDGIDDGLSLHYLDLSSTHSPNDRKPKLGLSSSDDYEIIYGDSNFLIVQDGIGYIYFIRVRDGKISSSYLNYAELVNQAFYLASQSLFLVVNRNGIRKLKIHNIENFLSS